MTTLVLLILACTSENIKVEHKVSSVSSFILHQFHLHLNCVHRIADRVRIVLTGGQLITLIHSYTKWICII